MASSSTPEIDFKAMGALFAALGERYLAENCSIAASSHPVAIIVSGAPGAGKETFIKHVSSISGDVTKFMECAREGRDFELMLTDSSLARFGNAVVVNPDHMRRWLAEQPEVRALCGVPEGEANPFSWIYKNLDSKDPRRGFFHTTGKGTSWTDDRSGYEGLANQLQRICLERGISMIVESAMPEINSAKPGDSKDWDARLDALKARGFKVSAVNVSVSEAVANERIKACYDRGERGFYFLPGITTAIAQESHRSSYLAGKSSEFLAVDGDRSFGVMEAVTRAAIARADTMKESGMAAGGGAAR